MSRALVLLAVLSLAACGGDGPGDAQEPEPAVARHDHQPQRGGRLVEIGEHVAQVEIVHDARAGTLTAYVMDGHAGRAVRLSAESLPVRIEVGGEEFTFDLKPVADPLTGETVGDTSRFEIRADLLERLRGFSGVVVELKVFDRVFRDVAFTYAPE